jgi:hypothetical protein
MAEDERLTQFLQCVNEDDEREYELKEEHLPFLFRALHSLASKWHGFCLQLDVKELDQIERNGTKVDDCLVLGLQSWLKDVHVSWRQLIRAIYQPAGGGNPRLARDVAHSFKEMCTFKPSAIAQNTSTGNIGDFYKNIESAVKDIQTMLDSKVAARWYQLGITLGARVSDLEMIRLEKQPALDCERMMLQEWLRNCDNTTWQRLVDSVGHVAGGNHQRLARTLSENKHT